MFKTLTRKRDPMLIPAGRAPVFHVGRFDFTQPIPLGIDDRGKPVELSLAAGSLLIGGLPRTGTTFVTRLIALHAALDPAVRLHIHGLAFGGLDWPAFEPISHRISLGFTEDSASVALADVLGLINESERRLDVARRQGETQAADPPVLLVLDDLHAALDHPEYGPNLDVALIRLLKIGRAAGIRVVAAIKPIITSMPSPLLRGLFASRLSLRVSSWSQSDLILGDGAYKSGVDATALPQRVGGTGILLADGTSTKIRTYLAVERDVDNICQRAAKLRGNQAESEGAA